MNTDGKRRLVCKFDPDDRDLIQCAALVGRPLDVRTALDHAEQGLRERLRTVDGAKELKIRRPATTFDAVVIDRVLEKIEKDEQRRVAVQWLPNPARERSPDIVWAK